MSNSQLKMVKISVSTATRSQSAINAPKRLLENVLNLKITNFTRSVSAVPVAIKLLLVKTFIKLVAHFIVKNAPRRKPQSLNSSCIFTFTFLFQFSYSKFLFPFLHPKFSYFITIIMFYVPIVLLYFTLNSGGFRCVSMAVKFTCTLK